MVHLHAMTGEMIRLLHAELSAMPAGVKPWSGEAAVMLAFVYGLVAVQSLLMCGVYAWIAWRLRRPDVKAFLAEGPGAGPSGMR